MEFLTVPIKDIIEVALCGMGIGAGLALIVFVLSEKEVGRKGK